MLDAAAAADDERPNWVQRWVARHGCCKHGSEFGVKRRCEKRMGCL